MVWIVRENAFPDTPGFALIAGLTVENRQVTLRVDRGRVVRLQLDATTQRLFRCSQISSQHRLSVVKIGESAFRGSVDRSLAQRDGLVALHSSGVDHPLQLAKKSHNSLVE